MQVVAFVGLQLLELLRVHGDDQRGAVVDQHPALGIEQATAGRLLLDDAHPVVGGLDLAALGRHHLQVVEAGEQGREQREHHDAEDAQPQAGGISVHRSPPRTARGHEAVSQAHRSAPTASGDSSGVDRPR